MKEVDISTLKALMNTIRGPFPDAEVGEEDEGQIMIFTGLYSIGDETTPLVNADAAGLDEETNR